MLTVYGEGRGFRVVWLLEEMGLPYRLRDVDLRAGVENDPAFLAVNPAGFIPALQDGDAILVESIAILQYLIARHGPTDLAPAPEDSAFPLYLHFLHVGEAGLATPCAIGFVGRWRAPQGAAPGGAADVAQYLFDSRVGLVRRQLTRSPYLAGERFTAADISVTYALELAVRNAGHVPDAAE